MVLVGERVLGVDFSGLSAVEVFAVVVLVLGAVVAVSSGRVFLSAVVRVFPISMALSVELLIPFCTLYIHRLISNLETQVM